MKILPLCVCAWLLSIFSLSAQVAVEVVLEQEQFLPSEAIPAAVRITNRSGQTLHLGDDDHWLSFGIEARDGSVVVKEGEVPVRVKGGFELGSSKVATKRVNLAPYFNLATPGRYTVIASVRVQDWQKEFTTRPAVFDIIKGTKLWEQEFGIPGSASSNGIPEVRKYILQQANYLKELKLYVRITDQPESETYKVFALNPMVSFSRPETQVDQRSNLHVLCQTGKISFVYTIINPTGEVTLRRTYDYTGSRPRLKVDDDGKISVNGGVRHISTDDFPSETEESLPDAKPKQP
jgi:hypothetical protein